MSRSHKGRKDFKVNNILARVVANKKKEATPMADFMTITFLGVYDKKGLLFFNHLSTLVNESKRTSFLHLLHHLKCVRIFAKFF